MFFASNSNIGKRRTSNQDSLGTIAYNPNTALFVVCDGMGGANGGCVASITAVNGFMRSMEAFVFSKTRNSNFCADNNQISAALIRSVSEANSEVHRRSLANEELRGMGTTLVASFISNDNIYTANVGDSRMYMIYDGRIVQVSHDHSYVQYLIDMGKLTPEEARTSNNRNIITRAVGTEHSVETDVFMTRRPDAENVYLLLCSDGLTNMLEDEMIKKIICTQNPNFTDADELNFKTEQLIQAANSFGGTDNITAVLVKI